MVTQREHSVVHRSSESDTATEIVYEESPVGDINANGSTERRAINDYTERQIGVMICLDG